MSRMDDYRVAVDAQNRRYEAVTGLPVGETGRQEYRDYFGVGDSAGQVETRVNLNQWMVDGKAESEPTNVITTDQAFYMSGADLASLAADGDWVAEGEIVRRATKRAAKRSERAA